MTFKIITYQQKNNLLLVSTVILFIISWLFSFSKAWNEYRQNTELTTQKSASAISNQLTYTTQKKFNRLDSLVTKFTVYSAFFENNFLYNISQCIDGLPVELSFNENKVTSDSFLQSNTITLQGDYKSLIQVIHRIEKEYFIKKIRYFNDIVEVEMTNFK